MAEILARQPARGGTATVSSERFAPYADHASAERLRRVKLTQQHLWGHAGDGTKLGDEVRLIVVAGSGGDARPTHGAIRRTPETMTRV